MYWYNGIVVFKVTLSMHCFALSGVGGRGGGGEGRSKASLGV